MFNYIEIVSSANSELKSVINLLGERRKGKTVHYRILILCYTLLSVSQTYVRSEVMTPVALNEMKKIITNIKTKSQLRHISFPV